MASGLLPLLEKMRLALLYGCLAACGPAVVFTLMHPTPRAMTSRRVDDVEVFSTAPPARRHVVVGRLSIDRLETQGTDAADLVRQIRQSAAVRGCDALFFDEIARNDPAASDLTTWLFNHPGLYTRMTAICLVYLD